MYAQIGNRDIDKIFNVGIYLRLSREDEKDGRVDESQSIQNQKEYIIRYVAEKKWNIAGFYSDDGWTGTNFNRPEFKRMLMDIENGKINLVITKDLSRLGRDYIETGYYTEKYFPEHHIRYIAITDGIDTFISSSNNDMTPFRAVINDMYARDISKKVRAVMDTKRSNGKFIGAFAPYGYKKNPHDKNKLILDGETAPIVKRCFDMYLEGQGFGTIARKLNDEGIICPSLYKSQNSNYKNPRAQFGLWTHDTIKCILMNPTYRGDITQNKFFKVNYKVKKLMAMERSNWITVSCTHEPIVDGAIFELVQKIIQSKTSNGCSSMKFEHLLAGFVFCGDCGAKLTFIKTASGYSYMICSSYKRFGNCSRHSINEERLRKYLLNDLRRISENAVSQEKLFRIAQAAVALKGDSSLNIKIKETEGRFKQIKNTIKNLYEDKIKGILSEGDFIDLTQEYNNERESLKLKLLELMEKKDMIDKKCDDKRELSEYVRECSNFHMLDRPALIRLVDKIEVFEDNKIAIHYKFKKPF